MKNDDWPASGTMIDAVKLKNHVLGLVPFTKWYDHIAADINYDCEIDNIDMLHLRSIALGIIPEVPNQESWQFFDSETIFGPELGPCEYQSPLPNMPMSIKIDLNQDRTYDFIGIKKGDIKG